MRPRPDRVGCVAAVAIAVMLSGACGGELTPRRSDVAAPTGVVEIFESPRRVVEVQAFVDPGGVEIPALVSGIEPIEVVAPDDGAVFDVLVAPGDDVVEGQPVLSFLAAATRAEELELSILELERELAIENGDDDELAAIDDKVAALQASWQSRSVTFAAPSTGVVSGTREGLELRVVQGRTLFTVSSPDSIAVTALSVPDVVESLTVGDTVTVRRAVVGARAVTGRVVSFEDVRDLVRTRIEFVDPVAEAGVELGDRVEVGFDVSSDAAGATWVPADALRRSEGRSYLLIERVDGALERFDTDVRRRTDSHVLVADPLERLAPGTELVLP